jgi:hypothetical protein
MRDRLPRATGWWLAATLALAPALPTAAQPGARERVVVRPFSGPGAARAREAVVQALARSKRYEMVPNDRAEDTAQELGADLSSDAGRAAVASRLEVSGFVSGTSEKRGRQLVLELQVYGGASGAVTDARTFRARRPAALVGQVKRRLPADLRRSPLKLEAPAAPAEETPPEVTEAEPEPEPLFAEQEPTPAREDEDESEAEPDDEDGEATVLEAALGVRFMTRSFAYSEAQTRLPEHSVALTPALHAHVRLYPAAPFTQGFASNLGVEAYTQLMLTVEATDGPAVYDTSSKAFGANVRARIPLDPSELGIHLGWGAHDVEIGDSQFGGDPEVPSVAYRFLRLGADGRIALSESFALSLRASYLVLLGFGELAEERWFPDASGGGIQAQVGASYALVGPLWLEADVGILHYFLSMNVEPAAAPAEAALQRVADGASDQQLSATLALALRL